MKKTILTFFILFLISPFVYSATLLDRIEDTSPTSDDMMYCVNDPGGTPADRKCTVGNVAKGMTVTNMISACTDAQVLGGTAGGTGVECQADADTTCDGGACTITNAGTVAALASNGANCAAGSYPLGVDAAGAVESCTDASTEINTAIATKDECSEITNCVPSAWDALTDMTLTDTYLYVGNGSNNPVGVALSGDATIGNTGVLDITQSVLDVGGTDALFPADPGYDAFLMWDDGGSAKAWATADNILAKMTLTDNYIWVGDASNDPIGVAMSNDCTIASNGAITCDHDALDNFEANEHIDWTSDQGATNIHTGNYTDTDTDDQTIDVFSFADPNISLSLEDDGEATKTLDISGLNIDPDNLDDEDQGDVAIDSDVWKVQSVQANAIDSDAYVNGSIDHVHLGTDIITGADAVGTFESGDTFLCNEAGVGLRECDYDDMPAGGGGGESLAATLAIGADANDLDITSLAKLEGVDVNTYIDMDGSDTIETKGNIIPNTDSADDLGDGTHYFANAYLDKIYLDADSTIEAGDVDGWNALVTNTDDQTLAEVLSSGADANDLDITSMAKLEGVDVNTYIDMDTTDIITTKGNLIPSGNGADDLGTDALEYNNAWFDGTMEADTITEGGVAVSNNDEIEAVVEPLIDTLANLSSAGGQPVAFADAGADAFYGWNDGDTTYKNLTDAEALTIIGGTANDFDANGDVTDISCTDCINATEIEDIYLLDDGDVGTGTMDFGGAVLEIPNGADVTDPASIGQVAIDSTSDQFLYYGTAQNVIAPYYEQRFTLELPTTDDVDVPIWHPNKAILITDVYCEVQGATSATIVIGDGTNELEAIVCDEDGQADDGSIANGAFTANERMQFDVTAISDTPDWVSVSITYSITAD